MIKPEKCTIAVRLLAVVVISLFGRRSFSAVGSKVRVRRPISLWAGEVLNPLTWVVRPLKNR